MAKANCVPLPNPTCRRGADSSWMRHDGSGVEPPGLTAPAGTGEHLVSERTRRRELVGRADRQVQRRAGHHHSHAAKLASGVPERKQPEVEPRRRLHVYGTTLVHNLVIRHLAEPICHVILPCNVRGAGHRGQQRTRSRTGSTQRRHVARPVHPFCRRVAPVAASHRAPCPSGSNARRVARMAASTTACLARLKPRKSRSLPAATTRQGSDRPGLAIVNRFHFEGVPATGILEDHSLDHGCRSVPRWLFEPSDRGPRHQLHVIRHMQHALAGSLQVGKGPRRLKRPQHEVVEIIGYFGAHRRNVDRTILVERRDYSFQYHERHPCS